MVVLLLLITYTRAAPPAQRGHELVVGPSKFQPRLSVDLGNKNCSAAPKELALVNYANMILTKT